MTMDVNHRAVAVITPPAIDFIDGQTGWGRWSGGAVPGQSAGLGGSEDGGNGAEADRRVTEGRQGPLNAAHAGMAVDPEGEHGTGQGGSGGGGGGGGGGGPEGGLAPGAPGIEGGAREGVAATEGSDDAIDPGERQ